MPTRQPFRQSLILGLALLGPIWVLAAEPPGLEMRVIEPALSDDVLFNPGMGLYLAGGSGLAISAGGGRLGPVAVRHRLLSPRLERLGSGRARGGLRRLLRSHLRFLGQTARQTSGVSRDVREHALAVQVRDSGVGV